MSIEVTARHMDDAGDVQDFAKEKAEALADEFPRVEHVHVILEKEKHRCKAEFFVQAKNHIRLEADDTSDNMQASIATAALKAEKQLRRLRDKVLDHRPKKDKLRTAPTLEENE
jgi:ribosomal subunit interface protein